MAHATKAARAAYARKWRAKRRAACVPCALCRLVETGRAHRKRMANLGSALLAHGLRRAAAEGRGMTLEPGAVDDLLAIFEDRFDGRRPGA